MLKLMSAYYEVGGGATGVELAGALGELRKDVLHIVRTVFLWRGAAYQRIGLQNHSENDVVFFKEVSIQQLP